MAQSFMQSLQNDDDQALSDINDEIENFGWRERVRFTTLELQRISLAQQRKSALMRFRLGMMSRQALPIISNYDWILDDCKSVTQHERSILSMAKELVQALHSDNDELLCAVDDVLKGNKYRKSIVLTEQEEQRLNLAQKRYTSLKLFKIALFKREPQQLVDAYDPVLASSHSVTPAERALLHLAQRFIQSLQDEDDQTIVEVWEEMENHLTPFDFTPEEIQRIKLARARKTALFLFRLSLIRQHIQPIVAAYLPILDACQNVTADERHLLALAQQFTAAYQANEDHELHDAWQTIQNSVYKKYFTLTAQESERIQRIRRERGELHA
jgi:hypothetical protein